MIARRQNKRSIAWLTAIGAAMALSWFLTSAAFAVQEPPPPDDRKADDGPDGPGEPDTGPDDRRGERPRDRFRRRMDERRPGRPGPDDQREPSPEMVKRMMEMMRDNMPEMYARLDKLRDRNPERFRGAIRKVIPVFKEYMMLQRDERPDLARGIVEEFKSERRLGELSHQYRDAAKDPAAQAKIAQEIETLVRKQIELRHQRMTFRLEQFEKRINEQKDRLERQRKRFEDEKSKLDEHVAKRVEEIKQGDLRRPFERHGPGGPDGFGEGPSPGQPGPDGGPSPGRRGPDDGPRHRRGPHTGRPDGPPPGDPPPPPDDEPDDE